MDVLTSCSGVLSCAQQKGALGVDIVVKRRPADGHRCGRNALV